MDSSPVKAYYDALAHELASQRAVEQSPNRKARRAAIKRQAEASKAARAAFTEWQRVTGHE